MDPTAIFSDSAIGQIFKSLPSTREAFLDRNGIASVMCQRIKEISDQLKADMTEEQREQFDIMLGFYDDLQVMLEAEVFLSAFKFGAKTMMEITTHAQT